MKQRSIAKLFPIDDRLDAPASLPPASRRRATQKPDVEAERRRFAVLLAAVLRRRGAMETDRVIDMLCMRGITVDGAHAIVVYGLARGILTRSDGTPTLLDAGQDGVRGWQR